MKITNVCPWRQPGKAVASCDVYIAPGVHLKRVVIKLMDDGTHRAFSVHSGNDRYSRIVLTAALASQIAAAAIEIMGGLKANDDTAEAA